MLILILYSFLFWASGFVAGYVCGSKNVSVWGFLQPVRVCSKGVWDMRDACIPSVSFNKGSIVMGESCLRHDNSFNNANLCALIRTNEWHWFSIVLLNLLHFSDDTDDTKHLELWQFLKKIQREIENILFWLFQCVWILICENRLHRHRGAQVSKGKES